MNEKKFISDIRKIWFFAKAVGIDAEFSMPTPLVASDIFKTLSRSPDSTYEQVFLEGIRGGQYNILLVDYSFLQFSYHGSDDLRYAYYPNPFLGASREAISQVAEMQEYVSEGIVDVDEFLQSVAEIRKSQHPPLVRYEYAKSRYVHLRHPSSHLHLGFHPESRWPVRRVVTPAAFGLLAMKLFYGEYWNAAAPIQIRKNPSTVDEELSVAKSDCRILPADEFSATEETHFFWG